MYSVMMYAIGSLGKTWCINSLAVLGRTNLHVYSYSSYPLILTQALTYMV
jgi:hypothetical protein